MTNPTLRQATKAAVKAAGYQPGSALEDTVALFLHHHCKAPRPEQQYRAGKFRLDFAWPQKKIALEADGWWHRSPEGAYKDRQRDTCLRAEGWLVFRVDDEDPCSLEQQIKRVARIIALHPDVPQPPPPHKRGGCRADVPDYSAEGWKRPCKNNRRPGSDYCGIHGD